MSILNQYLQFSCIRKDGHAKSNFQISKRHPHQSSPPLSIMKKGRKLNFKHINRRRRWEGTYQMNSRWIFAKDWLKMKLKNREKKKKFLTIELSTRKRRRNLKMKEKREASLNKG